MVSFDEAIAAIQLDRLDLINYSDTLRLTNNNLSDELKTVKAQLLECQEAARPPVAPVPLPLTLMEADFSDLPAGPFTAAMAKKKFAPDITWSPPSDSWFASKGMTIVKVDGISVLNVLLKASSYGGGGGPVFFVPLKKAVDDITFEMIQRFAPGFDPNDGGKLPGVGTTTTTANPPSGGSEPTTGNCCRHMFRTGGEATAGDNNFGPNACACYAYHPGQRDVWGDYEFLGKNFVVGEWDTVTTRCVNNAVGFDNGILQSKKGTADWSLNLNNYRWRLASNWLWNRFSFAVFRGGGSTWASTKDGHVQFKKFLITTPA